MVRTRDVSITSTPAGAFAHIEPSGQMLTTPGTAHLERKNSYTVTFDHEGSTSRTGYIDRETSGAVWGNMLLGGIIGLAIDFSNGAAYQLAPEQLHVDLEAASTPAAAAEPANEAVPAEIQVEAVPASATGSAPLDTQ
jgi:hypothetical protein